MTIITNGAIGRPYLPRTLCLICLTLMWMEAAIGLCLGCEIHGLVVRRGWATKDPEFEICANGVCDVPERTSQAEKPGDRRARTGGSRPAAVMVPSLDSVTLSGQGTDA